MKDLKEYINEQTVNEAKNKTVNTTVGRYVAWYFGVDDFDEIDPLDDFESTDFDPESLKDNFKGSYTAQYEFLSDHKDVKIKVSQVDTGNDVEAEFKVGGIVFHPVSMEFFEG